ncbi:TIGR03943 family protein [Metabacillus litoralis]|uniref:TIGR03943 family putative permease subunit n=1 Tax=Metabacillus litoralis TaxID=152268 RepID=UPI000EF58A64|nr:TIGR03943 family protein [Metabacillus litoralis]MCM3162366.1 TIGR03943 family protein [Metabacillus litoralis]UHA61313.1 TIGR03943 family protein [Metabacillus litoralis]
MEQSDHLGFQKFIRGIILVGFTMLLFKLIISGDITNFIAPKMLPFIYFATGTFLILGTIQIFRSDSKKDMELFCDCGLDHAAKSSPIKSLLIYSIFLFPILTGFMFPEVILDSSIVAKRGINLGTSSVAAEENQNTNTQEKSTGESTAADDTQPKSVDDLYIEGLLNSEKIVVTDVEYQKISGYLETHLDEFVGKEIELTGFVYREPDFTQDQMAVSRFTVSCCVADLQVMGTLATGDEVKNLKNDEWVKVTGVIEKADRNGVTIPSIGISSLEKVEAPSDPYIYIY